MSRGTQALLAVCAVAGIVTEAYPALPYPLWVQVGSIVMASFTMAVVLARDRHKPLGTGAKKLAEWLMHHDDPK